jgi:hypothetical protein
MSILQVIENGPKLEKKIRLRVAKAIRKATGISLPAAVLLAKKVRSGALWDFSSPEPLVEYLGPDTAIVSEAKSSLVREWDMDWRYCDVLCSGKKGKIRLIGERLD